MNIDSSMNVDALREQIQAEQFEAIKEVKLTKMAQESEEVVGDIIQDTLEISQEAMNRFFAEKA
jgi:hypothetical protein